MAKYSLGIDFGTESARAILADLSNGKVIATAVHQYKDGVIDQALPGSSQPLPPNWALQNPMDWLESMEKSVVAAMAESKLDPSSVVGIGIDFTACTVLPTTEDGTPLCALEKFRSNPHSWVKLWKHHGAQPQADRINETAKSMGEKWLSRYGGKISSEWAIPKSLQILEEAPEIYHEARYIIEGCDWLAWQLCGVLSRNSSAVGYKAAWNKKDGFPSKTYLAALHPELTDLFEKKFGGNILPPGTKSGGLTPAWAKRLGLNEGTPVAVSIMDAHAGTPGAGIGGPGPMFMIMGTSTCHMLLGEKEMLVEGICGVVEDGIVPGYFAYEAGQAGAGDIFAWFVDNCVPLEYHEEARQKGISLHEILGQKASRLAPGESGLLALDWWNGNRSVLVDADLSGLLVGATLSTRPEEIYRALIEATAFGTRMIIEAFNNQGVPVNSIIAGGGLTKNKMLMQIYADVMGIELAVTGADQVSALGAAMLGAVAAGKAAGGYEKLAEAAHAMAQPHANVYKPILANAKVYDELYIEYARLYDYFGRGENPVMKSLLRIKKNART
ncbi:MAG: ribulokinase [Leptolinea sp.]